MTRGEVWLTQIGRKTRPVLILTRPEVIDVRERITVVEITSSVRGLAAEVEFDHEDAGIDRLSVINCDGVHTIARSSLTNHVGTVNEVTMGDVCWAVGYALGC